MNISRVLQGLIIVYKNSNSTEQDLFELIVELVEANYENENVQNVWKESGLTY